MSNIAEVLIKKNFPHVVTVNDLSGSVESLSPIAELKPEDVEELLEGIKELHSANITVMDIKVGRSAEGQLKISDLSTFGFGETLPIHTRYNTPESKYIKFKSDLWCVGCFIFGKNIPKRFMKSQDLLDDFIKNSKYFEVIKNLLIIDPSQRNLDFINGFSDGGCIIH
jgi:serine/threonine protein kinase